MKKKIVCYYIQMTSKIRPNFSIKHKYPKQIFLPHKFQTAMPDKLNILPQGGSRNAAYLPYNKQYRAQRGVNVCTYDLNPKGFLPVGGSGVHTDGLKVHELFVSKPKLHPAKVKEPKDKKNSTKEVTKKDQIEHDGNEKRGYQKLDEKKARQELKEEVILQSLGGQIFKDSGAFQGGWRMRMYEETKESDDTGYLIKEGDAFQEVENLQEGETKQAGKQVMPSADGV